MPKFILKDLLNETFKFSPLETGGMILGKIRGKDYIINDHILGGPNAIHKKSYFLPDGDYQQPILEKKFFQSNGEITFLGDWHSHPYNDSYLSELDRKTLDQISKDKGAQISSPIFIIIGTDPIAIKAWKCINKKFYDLNISLY